MARINHRNHTGAARSPHSTLSTSLRETSELKRFDRLIAELSTNDRVAVVHHPDPDGVCAGVLISKLIERKRKSPPEFRHNQRSNEIGITNETVELLKKRAITHVFIVDMASDQDPRPIKILEKSMHVVLIDHHPTNHVITSPKTIMLKARELLPIPPAHYCTAKMVYDLGSRHVNMADLDWIAAVGIVADGATDSWLTFVREVGERYGVRMMVDPRKTEFGKIAEMINLVEAYSHLKARDAFKSVYDAKKPQDVYSSPMVPIADEVRRDVKEHIDTVKNWCQADTDHDALIGEVESKYTIKSHLTGELSEKYPHKTVICYQKIPGDKISVSAWRKDGKVKVNELLRRAVRHLVDASAGGHDTMSGGTIHARDLEKFKQELYLALDSA